MSLNLMCVTTVDQQVYIFVIVLLGGIKLLSQINLLQKKSYFHNFNVNMLFRRVDYTTSASFMSMLLEFHTVQKWTETSNHPKW